MLTQDEIIRNIRGLQEDIAYLENKLDGLDPYSLDAESVERILDVKYRLLSEQISLRERVETRAERAAAEIRLAYNDKLDQLDLY